MDQHCSQIQTINRIEDAVERLTETILGNSKPGLVTRLAIVEKQLDSANYVWREVFRWCGAILTGALLGLMGKFL